MAVLTLTQIAAVAVRAGFPPGAAVVAVAITPCESSQDAAAIQQGEPYGQTGWGLWQITPGNSVPQFGTNQQLLDPLNNARAAEAKWRGAGGFSPWTTFEDGCYVQHLEQAQAAVEAVTRMSPAALAGEVAAARRGGGGAANEGGGIIDWSPQVRASALAHAQAAGTLVAYGRATSGLQPRLRAPQVRPTPARRVVWVPGEELPS